MPPWVQEAGYKAWVKRLKDPGIRAKVLDEMRQRYDAVVEWKKYMGTGKPAITVKISGLNEAGGGR